MIKWDNNFSVGVSELDEHHKYLFKLCRELELLLEKPAEINKVQDSINLICALREYITFHFHAEEEIMRNLGFDNIDFHRNQHKNFQDEILKVNVDDIYNENYNDMYFLKHVLYDFIFNHIEKEDKKILQYIKQ